MKELIEGILQIANHSKIKEHLEPNVMWHQEIKEWMVKRVLYSYCLLIEEGKK